MSDTESTPGPGPQENLQNHDKVEGNVEIDKPSQAEGDVEDDNAS